MPAMVSHKLGIFVFVVVKLVEHVNKYAIFESLFNYDVSYAGERKQMAC